MLPKITIIIPSYNKASFIGQTLDSVCNQTFQQWECIVVDDGSSDASLDIVESYCKEDDRFTLLRRSTTKRGGSVCRNLGLTIAQGEYIIFLDADDILCMKCLEQRVAFMQKNEVDFAVFPMQSFYDDISQVKSIWKPSEGNHLIQFLDHSIPWQTMQPIWRKEVLLQLNGFDEDYPRLQDVEIHTRALLLPSISYKIVADCGADCYYRIADTRKTDRPEAFMMRWCNGAEMYISKMAKLLENKKQLGALRGTFFKTLTHLLHAYKTGDITRVFLTERIDGLRSLEWYQVHLGTINRVIINLYIRAWFWGGKSIKGYNFVFRKILGL